MQLNVLERSILGGLLAVANYLQLEQSISHIWHIVISCISILLGTIFIVDHKSEPFIDEPAPGTIYLPVPDEKQHPDVPKGKV